VARLAIARARAGETIDALSKRVGNAWDATETAVWNGLIPDVRLEAGQPVKVARSEIYLTATETKPRAAGPAGATPTPAAQPSR